MYIYTCSRDNLATHPDNTPDSFTSTLSQPLHGSHCRLGLVELSLQPTSEEAIKNIAGYEDGYVFVIVQQCKDSEAHGHRHPIVRMVALREFTEAAATSVIRFPTVQYIDIKDYHLSHITVVIRPCGAKARQFKPCCTPGGGFLKGATRCTFHAIGYDV